MSNADEAISVQDSSSDDNDAVLLQVSNVRYDGLGNSDTPIEIDSDDHDEDNVIYEVDSESSDESSPRTICRAGSKRVWAVNSQRRTSSDGSSSRSNSYSMKRIKLLSSPVASKSPVHSGAHFKQSPRNHFDPDNTDTQQALASSSKKNLNSSFLNKNNFSPAPPIGSAVMESQVRCPLCWLHFSSEIIEDHIDNCGKPPSNRRSTRSMSTTPTKDKNDEQTVSPVPNSSKATHFDGFTSSEDDADVKRPPRATTKLRTSLRLPQRLNLRAQADRKLPAKAAVTKSRHNNNNNNNRNKSSNGNSSSNTNNINNKDNNDRDFPLPMRLEVEDAIRQVRRDQVVNRKDMLKKMLIAKNNMLQKGKPNRVQPLPHYRRLPSIETQMLDSTYLRHEDYPIPTDSHHTVFIRKHFSSLGTEKEEEEDDEEVKDKARPSSPRVGPDSDSESSDEESREPSKLEQKYARQIAEYRVVRIALYEEDEADQEIVEILKLLSHSKYNRQKIQEYLALLLHVDIDRVAKGWEKDKEVEAPRRQHATQYEEVMSSFRDLFCRRCLIFDCNLHGLQDDYPPDIQVELAIRLENSGYWKTEHPEAPQICLPVGSDPYQMKLTEPFQESTADKSTAVTLTLDEKELSKRLYQLFQNDLSSVAQVMRTPEEIISEQVDLEPFEFKLNDSFYSNNTKSKQSKSNNYHAEWIKRIVQATSHPFFNPCTHREPCSEESCSCVMNRFFCNKACVWGASSRNFFRGCNCLSKCNAKSCPCFASNRECDPDLCRRCGACTDPPNQPATTQNCRNDNVGMRRHVHLLLGKSKVAGWGLYTKYALKKGDYVHEYLGELIPQNEAERRGKIYDDRNQTYIFDMSTDYAVDALQKGNKTRFINHSDSPNIGPQMKVVNGDYRIGFFALKDIPAQTELFFDYGDKFFKATGGFVLQNSSKKRSSS